MAMYMYMYPLVPWTDEQGVVQLTFGGAWIVPLSFEKAYCTHKSTYLRLCIRER